MNSKPHVLFVCNKWCEGRPEWGDSEYEQGFFRSLVASGLATAEQFNLDVKMRAGETDLEAKLIDYCRKIRPDFVFYIQCIPVILGFKTLDVINNQLGIPVVDVWGDSHSPHQLLLARELEPYVSLHVLASLSTAFLRVRQPEKYIYTWASRDTQIFYDPQTPRDIDLSFAGTIDRRRNRQKTLEFLRGHGVDVFQTGGERQVHLSIKEYAAVLQRSKLTLNFSHTVHKMVLITARAFEITLCGALMLEDLSYETPKFFTPYVDYVPYASKRDLLKKIRYYLAHDEERKKIARSGAKKAAKYFSGKTFWQSVMFRVLGPDYGDYGVYLTVSGSSKETLGWKLSWDKLAKLSRYQACKLMMLDWISSRRWSFWLYFKFREITDVRFMIRQTIKFLAKKPLLSLQKYFIKKSPASYYLSQYRPGQRPDLVHNQLRSYDDLINLPHPEVSVITPSLNLGKFLEDTIRSVANQSFRNFEHIVVDGGSTDGSVEILKKYPHIKWISEKDSGYPDAFYKGLKMARGKYIMQCMVTDAYAYTDWIKYCVDYLNQHPEISLVCGSDQDLSEDGVAGTIKYRDPSYQKSLAGGDFYSYCLIKKGALDHTSLCVKTEVMHKCYPPPDFDFSQMIDWHQFNYNFHKASYLAFLAPVVASFARTHQGQMGQRWAKNKLLKKRHKNFIKLMDHYRWRVIWGKVKPRFIDPRGHPVNFPFSRKRLLKDYLAYIFSLWFLWNKAKHNFFRIFNLAKRLKNSSI